MEVRWVISEGEETNPTETIVWWGCTLRPAPRDAAPAPGVWELHYDANVHLGFAAEIRPVRLTGAGTLEDPGEGTTLRWRLEGSAEDVDDSFDRDAATTRRIPTSFTSRNPSRTPPGTSPCTR